MTLAHSRELTGAIELFADPEQAAALSWGVAPLQFTASALFRHALDVDAVEGWLDCSLLQHPFFKVFLGDRQVPTRLVASPRSVAGQTVTGMIDGEKFRDVFSQGGTLMLCNMHEWHAPCRRLSESLTDALAAEVKATAFYSPPGKRGLATHRDDAHVFVVQIFGQKRWSVFDQPRDDEARRIGQVDPSACGPEEVVTLAAGDALYLPPYAAHHAYAVPTSSSLHLSIHVREPRERDVVDAAIDLALTAGMQRHEISGSAEDRAEQVRDVLELVAQRLANMDPVTVLKMVEKRFKADPAR